MLDELFVARYDDIWIMLELPVPAMTLRVRSDEVGRRVTANLRAAVEIGILDILCISVGSRRRSAS